MHVHDFDVASLTDATEYSDVAVEVGVLGHRDAQNFPKPPSNHV